MATITRRKWATSWNDSAVPIGHLAKDRLPFIEGLVRQSVDKSSAELVNRARTTRKRKQPSGRFSFGSTPLEIEIRCPRRIIDRNEGRRFCRGERAVWQLSAECASLLRAHGPINRRSQRPANLFFTRRRIRAGSTSNEEDRGIMVVVLPRWNLLQPFDRRNGETAPQHTSLTRSTVLFDSAELLAIEIPRCPRDTSCQPFSDRAVSRRVGVKCPETPRKTARRFDYCFATERHPRLMPRGVDESECFRK